MSALRLTAVLLLGMSLPAFAADWRAQRDDDLAELGERAEELAAVQPISMRNGGLRFVDPSLADATAWLSTRLEDPSVSTGLRLAYADAFVRSVLDSDTRERWEEAWLELAATSDDPAVRRLLVASLARASGETMADGLARALRAGDPELRRLAAHTASLHPDGARLSSQLLTAVGDPDDAVRADAVRSLGVLGVADVLPDAERLISDGDARVRGAALRALQRLSPERARRAAAGLLSDPDPAVARFAGTLAE